MRKGLGILVLSVAIFLVLRYIFPREMFVNNEKKVEVIDDFLSQSIPDEEFENELVQDTVVDENTVDTVGQMLKIEESILVSDSVEEKQSDKQKVKKQEDERKDNVAQEVLNESLEELYLQNFFKKLSILEKTKKGQLRIAYFGDSMIEADMIVMQLRHYFQSKFGGRGVGFVPITSVSAGGRYSIKHKFSNNWHKESFLKRKKHKFLFGIGGENFFVGNVDSLEVAEVQYRRGSAYNEVTSLLNPELFYGKELQDSTMVFFPMATVETPKSSKDTLSLESDDILNVIKLPQGNGKKITIKVQDKGTLPFYGVSFASKNGVILDNLSVRGNSGLPLTRLNTRLMNLFQSYMDYDLVILGYGTNVFSEDYGKSYAWYARRMQKVVAHMKRCFSGADIMIVSMADKSVKDGDKMKTPLALPDFISQQESFAKKSKSAFFNLYESMGGAGSMLKWVDASPSLANKDYTHFNSRGAEKVAKLYWNWFMEAYEKYKLSEALVTKDKE